MIEAFFKKLLPILNKPTHYLFVGLFLLLYGKFNNISNYIIMGGCLFFFAVASFTDLICKFSYKKFQLCSRKRKINNAQKNYKKNVIAEYETLASYEKNFVRSIVSNNNLVKHISNFESPTELNRIYSIKHRGWASYNEDDNLFIFDNKILKILYEYLEEQENSKKTIVTTSKITVSAVSKEANNAK